MIEYLGLWVLLAQALNMWALQGVLWASAPLVSKAVWAAILLMLPGLGFMLWFLFGPRRAA